MQSHQDDWDRHWADFAQANDTNPAQAYRQKLVLDLLRESGGGERILDIGSGTGALAAEAAPLLPESGDRRHRIEPRGSRALTHRRAERDFVQRDLLRADDVDSRLQEWATAAVARRSSSTSTTQCVFSAEQSPTWLAAAVSS